MAMQKQFSVSVDIHQAIKNGWRLKVTVPELGMYINGFRAHPSKKEPGEWAIFAPSQKVGSRWVDVVEFDHSMPLWKEIEKIARAVVAKREEIEEKMTADEETIEVEDLPF